MKFDTAIDLTWREACAALTEDDTPTIHSIALEVAREYGVLLRELRGMGREKDLCRARWDAWYRCKRIGKSSTVIGRYFGDRDHATVLHGIRQMRLGR
jgi:chromosomal replication initiator protein